jgi:AcrR family transcriptional regulator
MTPIVTEEYLESRRKQIIQATIDSFIEKGFKKATMKDICKAAKLSPGAVYNYFGSKDEIIQEIAELSKEQNIAIIDAALESNNPLATIGREFLSRLKKPGSQKAFALDLELFAEASRNPIMAKVVYESWENLYSQLIGLVERRQKEKHFKANLKPQAVVHMLFSLMLGAEIQKAINPKMNIDSYIAVTDSIVDGTFSKPIKKKGSGNNAS